MKLPAIRILTVCTLIALSFLAFRSISHNHQVSQLKTIQIKDTQLKLHVLEMQYDSALKSLDKAKGDQKALQDAEQKLQQLEQQKKDLEAQLQAKRAKQAQDKVYAAAPVSSVVPGCGDNVYANFIYTHESGCNLNSVNFLGCRGIGQACPGSKLPCGADYGCQNAYFSNYAISRYGSWAGAYAFWVAHSWW